MLQLKIKSGRAQIRINEAADGNRSLFQFPAKIQIHTDIEISRHPPHGDAMNLTVGVFFFVRYKNLPFLYSSEVSREQKISSWQSDSALVNVSVTFTATFP